MVFHKVGETYMKAEKTACEKGDACGNMFLSILNLICRVKKPSTGRGWRILSVNEEVVKKDNMLTHVGTIELSP
jgi:hypothetical protein